MALVQALPLTVLLILTECAVGGFLILLLTDLERRVSAGFLITSGLILAGDAVVTYLLKFGYGSAAGAVAPYLGGFTLLLIVYVLLVALKRRGIALVAGALAILVGLDVLYLTAPLQQRFTGISDLISVALATLVVGAAVTALLLGHWYLVTPLLSTQSLRRVTEVLLAGLALQVVFLVVQVALTANGATLADKVVGLISTYGFVFWFRVLVGLAFPILLGVLTWRSCRLRAMQTATGFLYIALGCVLAGDAAAKVFLVLTSISL